MGLAEFFIWDLLVMWLVYLLIGYRLVPAMYRASFVAVLGTVLYSFLR